MKKNNLSTSRNKNGYLVFSAPVVQDSGIEEVMDTLKSAWWGTGPKVKQFEADFADYKATQMFPVATNSCTAALHLSFVAAGLGKGDEVILPAMTFCATCNAIIHAGATPVPVDVDPRNFCIDPEGVRNAITPRTRAIVAVHFAGYPCNMSEIEAIAQQHNLLLIEDCAHAVETICQGRPAGTIGAFGCFSFYATKNVAMGEGGLILARNEEQGVRCRRLGLHGMSNDAWKRFSDSGYSHYQVTECGFKYNMMDLQAALGIHQLRAVEQHHKRRKEIWYKYRDGLQGLPIVLPIDTEESSSRHAYHLFTVLLPDDAGQGIARDDFLLAMHQKKIGMGVHYLSLLDHPFYQKEYGWQPDSLPVATRIGRQTASLPLTPRLTDTDVDDVITAVREVFS